jgi:hypothetical protein
MEPKQHIDVPQQPTMSIVVGMGMRRPLWSGCIPAIRPVKRMFSSRGSSSEEGPKIPSHLLNFSLLIAPCIIYTVYAVKYGPTDEVLEERIRERYDIAGVHQKNEAMRDFFLKAEQGIEDDRLQQVLHGGKTDLKRQHAVDKELYGTEKGLVVKQQTEEELQAMAEEKKRRRELRRQRRKEKGAVAANDESAAAATKTDSTNNAAVKPGALDLRPLLSQPAVAYALIGSIAVIAGYLAGSRRN